MEMKANVCGLEITCRDMSKFCVGEEVMFTVRTKLGSYSFPKRKVHDCKDGMYVSIQGIKVFYEDFN